MNTISHLNTYVNIPRQTLENALAIAYDHGLGNHPAIEELERYLDGQPPVDQAQVMEVIQAGHVNTGSEWDGWSLESVFTTLRKRHGSDDIAASMTDSVLRNRLYSLRNGFGRLADSIPLTPLPAWEYDQTDYFIDEVGT